MNNGNARNKSFEKMFVAIVVALVLVVVIVLVVFRVNANKPQNDGVGDNITASGETDIDRNENINSDDGSDAESGSDGLNVDSDNADNNSNGNNTDAGSENNTDGNGGNSGTNNNGNTTGGNNNTGGGNTTGGDNTTGSGNNTGSGNTTGGNTTGSGNTGGGDDNTGTTENGDEPITPPNVEITQRADADYEQWLAATMLVCVSMEYPDFQLEGIYTSSETTFEDKYSSDGAYIIFTSGGQKMAIHSVAISSERTAAGTTDISSQTLGYATFDVVNASGVNTSTMTEIPAEDLEVLIQQSLLISVYTH